MVRSSPRSKGYGKGKDKGQYLGGATLSSWRASGVTPMEEWASTRLLEEQNARLQSQEVGVGSGQRRRRRRRSSHASQSLPDGGSGLPLTGDAQGKGGAECLQDLRRRRHASCSDSR